MRKYQTKSKIVYATQFNGKNLPITVEDGKYFYTNRFGNVCEIKVGDFVTMEELIYSEEEFKNDTFGV